MSIDTVLATGRVVDLLLQGDGSEVVVEFSLVLVADLLLKLLLVENGLLSLLECLLNAGVHPVGVIAGGLAVLVIQLLLDVLPDLSVLKERVKLDDLHDLLFVGIEFVEVETNAVESTENR